MKWRIRLAFVLVALQHGLEVCLLQSVPSLFRRVRSRGIVIVICVDWARAKDGRFRLSRDQRYVIAKGCKDNEVAA